MQLNNSVIHALTGICMALSYPLVPTCIQISSTSTAVLPRISSTFIMSFSDAGDGMPVPRCVVTKAARPALQHASASGCRARGQPGMRAANIML